MFNRRQFLDRALRTSSLFALAPVVPQFIANTAMSAEVGKDTVLVVIEMTGGNDGLNMVIPYGDDLYHKARPTLGLKKEQVIHLDDYLGLHSALKSLETLLKDDQLAIVQGVGYPNPDRSHFESMDTWQSAYLRKKSDSGWIGRSIPGLQNERGGVPAMHVGPTRLPLALQGNGSGVVSVSDPDTYRLDLGNDGPERQKMRRKLLENMITPAPKEDPIDLLQFVQRRQLQTYATLDRLQDVLKDNKPTNPTSATSLGQKLQLIARVVTLGLGTRVFYTAIDGFDTHSGQASAHANLLQQLGDSLAAFFKELKTLGHEKRVVVTTFSEFGRRVQENGGGTDHGAASCLFVAGPGVKGGLVGKHPSLKDLDNGDLRFHTDFRRVYATLLNKWLGCDDQAVLGAKFEQLDLLRAKS
ncbi:MAG TPA: DUF1501 domain-containing protein [Gemmataceae bacterium]|nr:DUF1501 domain-containing protein [Gemmataceae bacterium]